MGQSRAEIAKEIVIAAIQSNLLEKTITGSAGKAVEVNEINAAEVAKFYKTVFKAVAELGN